MVVETNEGQKVFSLLYVSLVNKNESGLLNIYLFIEPTFVLGCGFSVVWIESKKCPSSVSAS